LAAITLDLFAVLFGGATALLPMFATDILHRDSLALGYLRAAPFLGAVAMAAFVAHRPLRQAGKTLLWAVAGFGLATIVFGFSRNFYLSLFMMVFLGAFDSISVILRGTLVQMLTPNRLMGRVQAVNFLFITSSNELGAFESGAVAWAFGPVFAVVSGGIGTLLVVSWVAKHWPELRKLDKLERPGKIPVEGELEPVR
jgi:MFS family permease